MGAIIGKRLVYGITEKKPLEGFPAGRVRIRQHSKEFAKAFVHSPEGLRVFHILDDGEKWKPAHEVAQKITI